MVEGWCANFVMFQRISVSTCTCARLAQSVERKALNFVVVGSSPTVGDLIFCLRFRYHFVARTVRRSAVRSSFVIQHLCIDGYNMCRVQRRP